MMTFNCSLKFFRVALYQHEMPIRHRKVLSLYGYIKYRNRIPSIIMVYYVNYRREVRNSTMIDSYTKSPRDKSTSSLIFIAAGWRLCLSQQRNDENIIIFLLTWARENSTSPHPKCLSSSYTLMRRRFLKKDKADFLCS